MDLLALESACWRNQQPQTHSETSDDMTKKDLQLNNFSNLKELERPAAAFKALRQSSEEMTNPDKKFNKFSQLKYYLTSLQK